MRGELSAPTETEDDAFADARALGFELRPEDIAPAQGTGVWAQNVPALTAFLVASTQWRVVAGAADLFVLGLDYAGARAGIEGAGIEITPQLWGDLQVIEAAALAELNRQRR